MQTLLVVLAALAVLGPAAHVLELPNKLALGGPLWLAIQQHLYRGWGPFLGAPVEIGALVTSLVLAVLSRRTPAVARPAIAATAVYAGMIGVFFLFKRSGQRCRRSRDVRDLAGNVAGAALALGGRSRDQCGPCGDRARGRSARMAARFADTAPIMRKSRHRPRK